MEQSKKNSDKQLLIQNITLLLNKLVYCNSKFNCSFQLHFYFLEKILVF